MTGLDLFAEKNNRKFKVASHLFDKCTRALDSIYNSGGNDAPEARKQPMRKSPEVVNCFKKSESINWIHFLYK